MPNLNNPDEVDYPVNVTLKVQGDVVGETTFVEGGDTNETITIDRSEADLEAGVIVNAWVNGEFLEGEHQFDVQCDQSTPTDENKYGPLAEFRVGATSVAVNESLTFNASASLDNDGDARSYEWDFGDGRTATGETVPYSYDSPGNYTVTLTVTDEAGATDTNLLTISVEERDRGQNEPPGASIESAPQEPT